MDIKIVSILDINELLNAKKKIEEELIKEGVIEDELSLENFIGDYVNLDKGYIYKGITTPFNIFRVGNTQYLFISEDKNNENVKRLNNVLKKKGYELARFRHIPLDEFGIKVGKFEDAEVLLFNDEYYNVSDLFLDETYKD